MEAVSLYLAQARAQDRPDRVQGTKGQPFADCLERSRATGKGADNLVCLGKLDNAKTTVSHLLVERTKTRGQVWDIVHDQANRAKDFRHIPSGESIYYDPGSKELIWGAEAYADQARAAKSSEPGLEPTGTATQSGSQSLYAPEPTAGPNKTGVQDQLGEGLRQAVCAYCGNAYERVNCYELVVQGLKDLGVNYNGRHGLQQELISRAKREGRPSNAYLTGEGLVSASGQRVFKAELRPPLDPRAKVDQLYAEILGHLQPGQVLSFSTPSRGHTGVVGRQGDTWTFVNSGQIDNPVSCPRTNYGVEEEDLRAELDNWLRRSSSRGETLQVTLGRLDPDKLAHYRGPASDQAGEARTTG
jgi:hypothetical protein